MRVVALEHGAPTATRCLSSTETMLPLLAPGPLPTAVATPRPSTYRRKVLPRVTPTPTPLVRALGSRAAHLMPRAQEKGKGQVPMGPSRTHHR